MSQFCTHVLCDSELRTNAMSLIFMVLNLQVSRRLSELISPATARERACHMGQMTEIQFWQPSTLLQ